MNAISIKNLDLFYGEYQVIDSVDLQIKEGEVVYIIGGNGSGKSTLIKSILGLLTPKKGVINIFGEKLSRKNISENFGYVPQYTKLDKNFPITVREMIDMECKLSNRECKMDTAEHLNYFNGKHLLDKKLGELSGGELQKVMIARSLVARPKILVLDEPTNNLDQKSIDQLMQVIKKENKEHNTTIIIITHDVSEMKRISERSKTYIVQNKKLTESK